MTKKGIGEMGVIILLIIIALLVWRKKKAEIPTEIPAEIPTEFEIATVGKVDSRFSMEFPEWGKGLTYIEISPIIGKYGRVFIAPPEDYNLLWAQLRENIKQGKYRELTSTELELYWIA